MNDNNANQMRVKEEARDTLLEKIAGLVRRLGRREGGAPASAVAAEAAGEGEPTGLAAERHLSQTEPTEAPGESERAEGAEAAGKSSESPEPEEKGEEKEGACCKLPMVIKRNIINSIEEVRRFAEEHELAVTAVESVLGMILEVAVGCAEGKVSRQMLLWALRVLNYERDKAEARRKGELDGRNAAIEERYFQGRPEDVPYLTSGTDNPLGDEDDEDDIFEMARSAQIKD